MKLIKSVGVPLKLHKEFLYQVVEIQSLTSHISKILLLPTADPLDYQAGQYVRVILSNDESALLSIACVPNEKHRLEFHLYHSVDNPRAIQMLNLCHEEKQWQIAGPLGVCTADLFDVNRPIIFFAHGTGFAPVKALVEALIKNDTVPEMHLYWCVGEELELYDRALIAKWREQLSNFKFTPLFVKDSFSVQLERDYADLVGYQAYAAASRRVVMELLENCKVKGMAQEEFYSDVV